MIEGLRAWARDDVHCEKWQNEKVPSELTARRFLRISSTSRIYEPTKIYNSINLAKIINSLYPETISVTQLFVNMHFTFHHFSVPVSHFSFSASIIRLMKVGKLPANLSSKQ